MPFIGSTAGSGNAVDSQIPERNRLRMDCDVDSKLPRNEAAVEILDTWFRDDDIDFLSIHQNDAATEVNIPVISRDWPVIDGRLVYNVDCDVRRWWITVKNVRSVLTELSEATEVTKFSIGDVELTDAHTLQLEAHFILKITVEFGEMDIQLNKNLEDVN